MSSKAKSRQHHRRSTAPSRAGEYISAIATTVRAPVLSGRTGLEPTLNRERKAFPSVTSDLKDPRVAYLQSGAWRQPMDNLPAEYVELAVDQATVIIVDVASTCGVVLGYRGPGTGAPVVLLPLRDPYQVHWGLLLAIQANVPIAENDQLARDLSGQGLFSTIPESAYEGVAEILVLVQRLLETRAGLVDVPATRESDAHVLES